MKTFIILIGLLVGLTGIAQEDQGIDTDFTCETCHTGTDWKTDVGQNFDHIVTGFELKGTHTDINCNRCHTGSTPAEQHQFSTASSECISCHEDIHRDQWGQDCERCHTPDSWTLSTQQQNHDLTNFPLQGPHRTVSCEKCHLANPGSGATLPLDCWGCHQAQYTATTNPSHEILVLDTDCQVCHTPQNSQWSKSSFNHGDTGYFLLGEHHTVSCAACHTQNVTSATRRCADCHTGDYETSLIPPHLSDGYPTNCQSCHDSFTWDSNFSHDQTGFLLVGAHESIACLECHPDQTFDDIPETCGGCHRSDWEASVSPPHESADFDLDCEDCHTTNSWLPSAWQHDSETEFLLTGAHIGPSCEQCHLSIPYSEQVSDCVNCHQADYDESREPDHLAGGIPVTCEVCHTTIDWESEEIDHTLTQFPLEGAHSELECTICHEEGYDLPIICEGCHLTDYSSTATLPAPDHTQYAFSKDCLECHDQEAWRPTSFNHDSNVTGFEIEGAHLALLSTNCYACHSTDQWSGLSSECSQCHQSNFDNTTDPDHVASGLPANLCETCHSQTAWEPSIFSHESTTSNCETCHLVQYTATTSPPHAEWSFPVDCASCHTTDVWSPSTFTHDVETTGFLVDGAHDDQDCNACHANWDPPTEVRTCASASCHQNDYTATTEPPHSELDFPMDCATCHTTQQWAPSSFSHDVETTGFLIDGAHEVQACSSCHSSWEPPTEIRTCESASCHQATYTATTNPPHIELAFPTDCASCHTTQHWSPSSFSHDVETTGFLLDGAHEDQVCTSCHSTWEPPTEIRSCASASCHQDNYSATTDPPHETMTFSQNCETCHSTSVWAPSQFVHDDQTTQFALEGAHTEVNCQQCHSPWQVIADPRTCADGSCHLPDYESTTNPNHSSDSFPLECETCHTQTAWDPATFDHDGQYFPIYSGQHQGEWNDCSQCHIDANDFNRFTCFGGGCHEINDMNGEHCEGGDCETCNGITYPQSGVTPDQCYTCHPNGDEDDCGGDLLNFFKLRTLPHPIEKVPDATD